MPIILLSFPNTSSLILICYVVFLYLYFKIFLGMYMDSCLQYYHNRGSMSSSDNYRGISMSNSLCKLFDYIFIELNADSLKTDDMQFGFKRNHSTVLCSAIYIETINHYVNEGSNVYSCLIDASKAFDRVHRGRLFKILIERNVSTLFIRLLLDSYIRQKSCVGWGVFKSNYFSLSNGVKQGGVLSPVLFTLHIDNLLIKLKLSGVGCF